MVVWTQAELLLGEKGIGNRNEMVLGWSCRIAVKKDWNIVSECEVIKDVAVVVVLDFFTEGQRLIKEQ